MQRSLERFQLAPDEFFTGVDRGFADLRATVAELAGYVDAQAALITELSRARVQLPAPTAEALRWSYDARLPNFLFEGVFEPETQEEGAKRWVGVISRICARLRMPRHLQYEISIDIDAFVSPEAARSFYLRVNGVQYPWLSRQGLRYTSFVLDDARECDLAFEIGIDPETIPEGQDVSFAFRSIDVRQRR